MSKQIVTTTKLDYNDGTNIVENGTIRISASSIANYFKYTRSFWGQMMLDESGFEGSTASVLGTCVHYTAETYAKHGELTAETEAEIEKYIEQFENPLNVAYDPDIECDLIRTQWPLMARELEEQYLVHNKPVSTEDFLFEEILPGIGVGGSSDAVIGGIDDKGKLINGVIVDYKTTSAKTPPKTISFEYRLQLLVYAWLYTKRGHQIDRIRIVFVTRENIGKISEKTGKQLKSYPAQVNAITEIITTKDLDYIEGIINLISDSIQCWQEYPTLRYLIAQDYRLKIDMDKVTKT